MQLTKHQRHDRVLKNVRKWYQIKYKKSRLFVNRSGFAWVGNKIIRKIDGIELKNARPIPFGIPDPGQGSGGADLIGITLENMYPVFTAIEIKTGNAKLQKNQIDFRNWVESVQGKYYIARECNSCISEGCKKCNYKGWDFEKNKT